MNLSRLSFVALPLLVGCERRVYFPGGEGEPAMDLVSYGPVSVEPLRDGEGQTGSDSDPGSDVDIDTDTELDEVTKDIWTDVWRLHASSLGGAPGTTTLALQALGDFVVLGASEGLYFSDDGGVTWGRTRSSAFDARAVNDVLIVSERVLFAATDDGVFRSLNSGASWTDVSGGLSDRDTLALAFDGVDVYVVDRGDHKGDNLYMWDASAVLWVALPETTFTTDVHAVDGQVARVFGARSEIHISEDRGQTWANMGRTTLDNIPDRVHLSTSGTALASSNSSGDTLRYNGEVWGATTGLPSEGVTGFAVDGVTWWAATQHSGLYRSVDDGRSWVHMTSKVPPGRRRAGGGVTLGDDEILFGNPSVGVWRSTDGGSSWRASNLGLYGLRHQDLIVDRSALLTAVAKDDIRIFDSRTGVWSVRGQGLPAGGRVVAIEADDARAAWYAGTVSHGMFRSVDGGIRWEMAATGLPKYVGTRGLQYREVADLFAADDGDLWVAFGPGVQRVDGRYQVTSAGVARSTDQGLTYHMRSSGLPKSGVDDDGEALYYHSSTVWDDGLNVYVAMHKVGLFRSGDNGTTWASVSDELPKNGSLVVPVHQLASGHDGAIYAALGVDDRYDTGAVARSYDSGDRWRILRSGLPKGRAVKGVVVADSAVFAVLDGADGGVWRLDDDDVWIRVSDSFSATLTGPLRVHDSALYAPSTRDGVVVFRW